MRLGILCTSIAAILLTAPAAPGETTHTYAVTLTISVDRAGGILSGAIESDAPSEFCDSSTVRIRQMMPGKDKVVARVSPTYLGWRLKSFPAIGGKRVFAEILPYHLSYRPVECLGARSRTVTAP